MQLPDFPPGNLAALKNLIAAVAQRAIVPLQCTDVASGQPVWVLGAFVPDGDGVKLVPLAKMFDGDPYKELIPPMLDATITEAA